MMSVNMVLTHSPVRQTADCIVVFACEKGSNQRSEAVGKAHTCKYGDVEEIVYKRRRGQRVGGVMAYHYVVGKTDSNITELTGKRGNANLPIVR